MTFKEFAGVKCADIDIKTGKRLEHADIYRRAIQRLGGIEAVKPLIPFKASEVRKAIKAGDVHLNTLPLKHWDSASGFACGDGACRPVFSSAIYALYRKHGITSVSCAEGVCLLKEAARMIAESEE